MGTTSTRRHLDDLRGASRLAIDATTNVTSVVEAMPRTIAPPSKPLAGLVYETIRGVTRLVGVSVEAVLSAVAPLFGKSPPGPERELMLAVLNGVLGDHLSATDNPLAI